MKKILILLLLIPLSLGAINILISDSNQSHAETCSTYIATYCPTANITIRLESLGSSVIWAIANDINIISCSLTGMSDDYQSLAATAFADSGIGIVHAHGSNNNTEYGNPSYINYIITVGCGINGVETGSYGNGLEWFVNEQATESVATAISAGIIGQLMVDHSWTFNQARQALRQTASNWDTGWVKYEGFGYINYNSADSLITDSLFVLNTVYRPNITSNAIEHYGMEWNDDISSEWQISCAQFPELDDTVSVVSSYLADNYTVAGSATFSIYPTGSRTESFSNKSARLRIMPPETDSLSIVLPSPTGIYETLFPNEDISIGFSESSAASHYDQLVTFVSPDNTYIKSYSDSSDRFGLENTTATGVINSISIIYRVGLNSESVEGYDGYIYPFLYIASTSYELSAIYINSGNYWENIEGYYTWNTNPNTQQLWNVSDINSLNIGVRGSSGDATYRCTVLYIAVDYTPAAATWSNKICGSEAAGKVGGVEVANIQSVMGIE
jgi:hypothetical protein